jgi:hypothetical protein
MSSYQSDQFFSRRPNGESLYDRSRARQNDAFIYPNNTIRISTPDGKGYGTRVLQKGYIRRINEFNDGNEYPVMCRFQFNPQYINQGAQFNSSITNPIYQPIEQLKQPIASMTNFSFRLMFDRSMELNSDGRDTTLAVSDNPWEAGSPSQVGVLHDINSLFRVIGQGVSADDMENAIARAEQSLSAGDARIGKDSLTDEENNAYESAKSNSAAYFRNNANIGNTAFILPQPVRIVFSSLYIVEGFVTGTALEILKFSSSYVPMQAQVTLSVSAIYLGFAKKKTYFTHVLEQSAIERRNSLRQAAESQNTVVKALREQLSRLHVKLVRGDVSKNPPLDRPATGTTAEQIVRFNQLFDDFTPPSNKGYNRLYVYASPTDWVVPKTQETTGSRSPGTSATTPTGATPTEFSIKDYGIGGLLESGVITNITIKWKARLIGPFNANALRFPFSTIEDVLNSSVIKSSRVHSSSEKTVTVNTKKQWIDLADPGESSKSQPPFIDIVPLRYSANLDEFNSWLFLVEATITATVNGVTLRSSSTSAEPIIGRTDTRALSRVLSFSWDSFFDSEIDASKQPSSGARSPQPGEPAPTFEFRIPRD